jgi:signal transduction histidine kinase
MKDEFLATLSHELRTPLNSILGWSQMLRTGAVQPDVRQRALESIGRNARAQSQLVEDLLDVSRVISGKLAIKADAVDLTPVIAGAVDTVRPAATAKRVDIHELAQLVPKLWLFG